MTISIRPLFILTFSFILFTAVGTVSHEYGHIMVARSLGYTTSLHYGSMNYENSQLNDELENIYNEYQTEIQNGSDFEKKAEYESGIAKLRSDDLLVSLGGPLQTTLTGTIGLLILIWRRKKIHLNGLKTGDWLAVFLALFWLREVFNLLMSITRELISPDGTWFGGDELHISQGLNLWPGTIPIIMGVLGMAISIYVVFVIVPKNLRLTLIISGLMGGINGFALWMNGIGPVLLP